MEMLRITRSRDIGLYIGSEQLYGVTDFSARSVYESYPVREYLSGEPVALVNGKHTYEIRMTVLSLFRFAATEGEFTLSVIEGDTACIFEGCTVVRRERSIKAGKAAADEFVITAKNMRRQVQANAG